MGHYCNAVILVTCLVVEGTCATNGSGERICNSMAKLLTDPCVEVQVAAASNMGKICIALSSSTKQRLILAKSEDIDA